MIDLQHTLLEKQIFFYRHSGVSICKVSTMYEGFKIARELLYTIVDKTTVLYLSGGRTPKGLYENLSNDRKLLPGAVALVDERYGIRFHNMSNEKMIRDSGLLPYLSERGVPFYPILQNSHPSLKETADNYDMTLRYLFAGFPKSVAIIGIGSDGHTAGIAPDRENFHNPMFDGDQKNLFVSSYADLEGPFKERVSMTFLGLSMIDVFFILAFGEEKKEAIQNMFQDGSEEAIPARFFRRPEIAQRTLFITDQKV